MGSIYLRHDQHGSKVAINEAEAVYDEQSGWERYDPEEESQFPSFLQPAPRRGRPRREEG